MNDDSAEFLSHSTEDTERLGRVLATLLEPGAVVALVGELGAGKTCLVRGMTSTLAPAAAVHSPTFTLINQYGSPTEVYHVDLYRLGSSDEAEDIGLDEVMRTEAVCVIEWAEKALELLPDNRIQIEFEHVDASRRRIRFTRSLALPQGWRETLEASLQRP